MYFSPLNTGVTIETRGAGINYFLFLSDAAVQCAREIKHSCILVLLFTAAAGEEQEHFPCISLLSKE
jgi:hypothetical protein